jgi:hypothetical protein
MDRKAKFYGWEFHVKQDPEGFMFQVAADPDRQRTRQEVFGLMDQVARSAREAGIGVGELFLHTAKAKVDHWTGRR